MHVSPRHVASPPPRAMPICIECRYPVNQLYTTYSAADDRSLGKGVRLTQCPRCKRFADKYVEHDFVVLFIDLVLIKPQVRLISKLHGFIPALSNKSYLNQVYRHLLFNRLGREDDRFDVSIAVRKLLSGNITEISSCNIAINHSAGRPSSTF